jgi:hypothetical protein
VRAFLVGSGVSGWPYDQHMSPTCEPQPPRPLTADEINDAIRAYLQPRTGRPLHNDEAAEYGRMRDAWVAATRAEVAKAA